MAMGGRWTVPGMAVLAFMPGFGQPQATITPEVKEVVEVVGQGGTLDDRAAVDNAPRNTDNPAHPTGRARLRDAAEGVAPANSQAKGPIGTGRKLRTLERDGRSVHRRGARKVKNLS